MSKSPWGKIGSATSWAEQAEAEEQEQAAALAASRTTTKDTQSYPTLKEAASTAATTKQKKKTKMSLQEFTSMQASNSTYGFAPTRGLTPEEMLRLPTGPKERSPDEMLHHGRLGGGFRDYGTRDYGARSGGPGPGRIRDDPSDGSWGGTNNRRSYAEDDRRRGPPQPRVSEFEPSRADEVDNWAMTKKPIPSFDSGPVRPSNKYASLGTGGGVAIPGGGGFSKADEVDNWAASKKPTVPAPQPSRSSFGSGFRSGQEPERWTRDVGGDGNNVSAERHRLVLEPKSAGDGGEVAVAPKVNRPSPFGAARPREEVLAEKGLDWKKLDMEIEVKKTVSVSGSSRPGSSHSTSRPGSAQSSRSDVGVGGGELGTVKPRPKVNPFGDAKPREVLLEEKGLDWRKIDLELEHKRIDRPETVEEKSLKEEIEHLKQEAVHKSGEELAGMQDLIIQKERDLELLIRELDDKVRFGQKGIERPGSGGGRVTAFPERPGSGAGRVTGFPERPGSGAGRVTGFPERPGSGAGRGTGFPERPGSGAGRVTGFAERPGSGAGRVTGFPERSGSGAGRVTGFPERSPSQHGMHEEPRNVDFMERSRSHGTGDAWIRPGEDRRGAHGGRERGFFGSREVDRSMSRERW